MGTMLLRRATQVVNRINRETAFEIEQDDDAYGFRRRTKKVVILNATASVNLDGGPVEKVEELRTAAIDQKTRMFQLMEIGTRIRKQIGKAQAEHGINALVTERVMLVRQQTILEHLLGQIGNTAFDKTDFTRQVKAAQARLNSSGNALPVVEINTVLFTTTDRNELRGELIAVKRQLMKIDDRLAELNSDHTIAISHEDETILTAAGII